MDQPTVVIGSPQLPKPKLPKDISAEMLGQSFGCQMRSSLPITSERSPSPVVWRASLERLSQDLSRICHTPPEGDKRVSPLACRNSGNFNSLDVPPGERRPVSVGLRLSLGAETRAPQKGPTAGSGDGGALLGGGNRLIRVRHEETALRLKQSLTAICGDGEIGRNEDEAVLEEHRGKSRGNNSESISGRKDESLTGDSQSQLKRIPLQIKESLKSGVRVKLDPGSFNIENIAVSVTLDSRVIKVCDVLRNISLPPKSSSSATTGDTRGPTGSVNITADHWAVIHSSSLSNTCSVASLIGSVVNESLYVRERAKLSLLDYSSSDKSDSVYVPLLMEDEATMRFMVVLHVPLRYSSNDIVVKTIDDSLVIKGQRSVISAVHAGSSSRFSVTLKLPEGSDSRSVVAERTQTGQLIVRGQLNPASRRMTCNF